MEHLDKDFTDAVQEAIKTYEKVIYHFASRTHQMIEMYGEIEALSRLMKENEAQRRFKVLWRNNQLDKSFEMVILNFKQYFKKDVIENAQFRLSYPEEFVK
jgi:hypothetical protein